VVNDFTDPHLLLDQNPFIAQVNTLCTNTIVARASQLWVRGFANASSQLLFSRIFCSWMCENSLSHENREGRLRMRWSFRVMRQRCSVSSYTFPQATINGQSDIHRKWWIKQELQIQILSHCIAMDKEIKGGGLDLNAFISTPLLLVLSPGRSNKNVAIFYGLFWTACVEVITAVESWEHQAMTLSYTC